MNLQEVNLMETACPKDTTIEIEGLGKLREIRADNLLNAIRQVFWVYDGRQLGKEESALKKITLLEFDKDKKFVNVRIVF